jgi:hypothetical protein
MLKEDLLIATTFDPPLFSLDNTFKAKNEMAGHLLVHLCKVNS